MCKAQFWNCITDMTLGEDTILDVFQAPVDTNAATHLIRHALGGTDTGLEHSRISQVLSLPQDIVRLFRDDITITVAYFDSEFISHCPL